ncbi:hypothetical protein FOCC_FOCC016149 [Frankliniella occidentalis]|nr:hypothetical protein FOCC_FOCC016149 [Frankliniella occidentalis]
MDNIRVGVQDLLCDYSSSLQREIESLADPVDHKVSLDAIQNIFSWKLPADYIFRSIDTRTKLQDFAVNFMKLLVPEEIDMGRSLIWKKKPTIDLVEKVDKFYYMSFLPALQRLLQNKQVRDCVDNPKQSNNVMKSVLDGNYFKTHPFFSRFVVSLAIILYYDEVEFAAALGSKTQKLGIFYWSLANIYPELRSTFQAINLLAIGQYKHIRKYGIDKILDRFVSDINKLMTEGVSVLVDGHFKVYKGSLLFVTADTPAAALVGGFKRSVSASKPCRRCMASQLDYKLYFNEGNFVLRTMNSHADHVEAATDATMTKQARAFWSKTYGVNSRSSLMDIDGFNILSCLVQDGMHILSEEVIKVCIRNFLGYCVEENLFTLVEFNERIDLFNYQHMSRDKPSHILPDHLENNLRQSAAQMLCLCYVLPFLVNNLLLTEEGEEHEGAYERLDNHVQLLQIVNCCFAFEVSEDRTYLLSHQIEIFIRTFVGLYPDAIVPKFHLLIHFPRQMRDFRPARQQFCMRFEAAHSYYKTIARAIRNFKNLPWSLANRQEALRCFELWQMPGSPSPRYLYSGHQIKCGKQILISQTEVADALFRVIRNVDRETVRAMSSPQIIVHGTTYQHDSVILVSCEEDQMPVFAKVKEILVYREENYLVYQTFETLDYSFRLNAYNVKPCSTLETSVINIKDLLYPFPLSIFNIKSEKYIVLFYHERSENM